MRRQGCERSECHRADPISSIVRTSHLIRDVATQSVRATTARLVTFVPCLVGQGSAPNGSIRSVAPSARSRSVAIHGPPMTTLSGQSGRPPGK